MTINQTRAFSGLRMVASPTSALVANDVTIGVPSTNTLISGINTGYACQALIVGSASDFVLDIADNDKTGSTSWTAGVAQVDTATANGTVTASGNATVTVTSAGMTGSPLAVSVAVTNGDTAAVWAGKVRTALAANATIAERFIVGGTSTAISLTRKPLATYAVGSESVPIYPANDSTLNIALATGTATGITAAATSTDTTAGVLTAGVYAPDADGKDFEGNTLTAIATGKVGGYYIKNEQGGAITIDTASSLVALGLPAKASVELVAPDSNAALETFTVSSASISLVTIVVCGTTA